MGTGKAEMIFSIVEREVINFMKSLSTVARFSLVKTGIRTRFLRMYFIFIVILMYLLQVSPRVSKEIFIFMLCILMNNKDLFDLIYLILG